MGAIVNSFTGWGSRLIPCSTYARQIGAVPSGRSVSERSPRSVNVYISFWTTSDPAPDVRSKSAESSNVGVRIWR